MANTPIPTHAVGDVLSSPDWNTLTPLNTSIGLFGVGSAISGSPPAGTAPNFLPQCGTSVVTTSGGIATITFPSTFPNGVVTVLPAPGDAASSLGQVVVHTTSTSNFTAYCYTTTGSAITASSVRINWIAIGF